MNTNLTVAHNAEKLATFLRANPDLPEPTHFEVQHEASLRWLIWGKDLQEQKETAAAVVRFIPGTATKSTDKYGSADWIDYSGEVDGVSWDIVCQREAVCERVVTGTKTITREVPDPTVVVPTVEVTEEVETVEWVCGPLLADGQAA